MMMRFGKSNPPVHTLPKDALSTFFSRKAHAKPDLEKVMKSRANAYTMPPSYRFPNLALWPFAQVRKWALKWAIDAADLAYSVAAHHSPYYRKLIIPHASNRAGLRKNLTAKWNGRLRLSIPS